MELLTFFILTLGLASCFFAIACYLLVSIFKRFSDLPVVWLSSMTCSFLCAIIATALFALPSVHSQMALPTHSMHSALEPLKSIILMPSNYLYSATSSYFLSFGAIYLVGAIIAISRLVNGRLRAVNLALDAVPFWSPSEIPYRVSKEDVAPFIISSVLGKKKLRNQSYKCKSQGCPNSDGYNIVISSDLHSQLSSTEIKHILLHERSHHMHHDDQIGLMLRAILALSWFCPFSYWMFQHWSRSIELRSDQSLLMNRPKPFRRAYANTLLKALKLTAYQAQQYPAASFLTNRLSSQKKRLKSILHGDASTFSSFSSKSTIVCGALAITLGMASVTSSATYVKVAKIGDLINKDLNLILSGRLTASFGPTKNPFKNNQLRDHKGIDLAAAKGTPIYAPEDGVVLEATDIYNSKPNYGKVVLIKTSKETKTLFAHLDSYSVKAGQHIQAGELLATVGETGLATGPHVHMETYIDNKLVNPLDVWKLAE